MIIRKLEREDLPTRVEWMNNPKVYSTMHFDIPVSLSNTIKWFENNRSKDNRIDMVVYSIDNEAVMCAFGEVLAFCGLTGVDYLNRKAELYVFVNPDLQGKGIGTKATRLLCEYGFKDLGLNKIYLLTDAANKSAQIVYERVGFKLEGVLREENYKCSKYNDRLYYGLLRREFLI